MLLKRTNLGQIIVGKRAYVATEVLLTALSKTPIDVRASVGSTTADCLLMCWVSVGPIKCQHANIDP